MLLMHDMFDKEAQSNLQRHNKTNSLALVSSYRVNDKEIKNSNDNLFQTVIKFLEKCLEGYSIIETYRFNNIVEKDKIANYCIDIIRLALSYNVNNEYNEKGYLALAKMMNYAIESDKMLKKDYSDSAYELLTVVAQIAAVEENSQATYAAFSASVACRGANRIISNKEKGISNIELSLKDLKQVIITNLKNNNISNERLYTRIKQLSSVEEVKELINILNGSGFKFEEESKQEEKNIVKKVSNSIISEQVDVEKKSVEQAKIVEQDLDNKANSFEYAYEMESYTKRIMLRNVTESVLVQSNRVPGYVYHLVKG